MQEPRGLVGLLEGMAFQRKVGIQLEGLASDGPDLLLPFDAGNLTVPGVLSAGAVFLLGETAGAALLWMVFEPTEFGLLARRVEVRFLRPANFDIRARPRTHQIRWETLPQVIRERGRGRATVPVEALAPDGRPVARVTAEYAVFRRG